MAEKYAAGSKDVGSLNFPVCYQLEYQHAFGTNSSYSNTYTVRLTACICWMSTTQGE